MRKSYRMKDLCCANCAARMEGAIRKIDGVDDATIAFMTQRLTIETERNMDEVLDEAQKIVTKIEKDCRIVR